MTLNATEIHDLTNVVNRALDRAEAVWNVSEPELCKAALRSLAESTVPLPSKIPGHSVIYEGHTKVDDFIAMVVDIRGSTSHLLEMRSGGRIDRLQRVYYETSALLPSCAMVINSNEGGVTEYLGDGLLGLFQVLNNTSDGIDHSCYTAYHAATETLENVFIIVNPILWERFEIPKLTIGIGLARSKAIVELVGLPGNRVPKVIGECVYRASKLACGFNEIIIDENLKTSWPKRDGGKIRFLPRRCNDIEGYLLREGNS